MAPRKPATAAQIAEVLRAHPRIRKGHALPYYVALTHLRLGLRTTSRKAKEWFTAATMREPHEFELIGTVDSRIHSVGRGEVDVLLSNAGYADESEMKYWPQLLRNGTPVSKEGDADDGEFVVLSKDLRSMCVKAAHHRAITIKAAQTAKDLAKAGAEERYGQALAYLRGMLFRAGLDPELVLDAAYKNGVTGEGTLAVISLKDGDIDAVAGVLAGHDVEPHALSAAVTRKPTTSDVAG